MAVFHIVGNLGSGKTLWTVQQMIDALLYTNQHIYTNIRFKDFWDKILVDWVASRPVHVAKFLKSPFTDFEEYKRFMAVRVSRKYHYFTDIAVAVKECMSLGEAPEKSRLMYWDEIHLDLNSREWKKTSMEMIRFFSMSRKLGFDVYIISQLKGAVDRQMRDLADVSYELKNLSFLRPFGLRIFPAVGVLSKRWANGSDESKRVSLGFAFVKYSDEYGKFYNTKQLLTDKSAPAPALWINVTDSGSLCRTCSHLRFTLQNKHLVEKYFPVADEVAPCSLAGSCEGQQQA